MLGQRKLVVDTFSEISDLIEPFTDAVFWDFAQHADSTDFQPGAIYVIGRQQVKLNAALIRSLIQQQNIRVIFSNPNEGSETLAEHCALYRVRDLVVDRRMFLISGGDMDQQYPHLQFDSFLPKILDYEENLAAIAKADTTDLTQIRPYKFLFLNGRTRAHRKYLLEQFRLWNLLEHSLYTYLDNNDVSINFLSLVHQGRDLISLANPSVTLPAQYEVDRYRHNVDQLVSANQNFSTRKHQLFDNEWGEIYLHALPYMHTHFSMVTETVFNSARSFRTEKLWKPIAMGHPFVVAAGPGYLRDLRQLGFKTFDSVIDESYDLIDNHQDRIARIAQTVRDLCQQDLASFSQACYNVCKYNQQHLAHMRVKVRQEFPERFVQFIKSHGLDE